MKIFYAIHGFFYGLIDGLFGTFFVACLYAEIAYEQDTLIWEISNEEIDEILKERLG